LPSAAQFVSLLQKPGFTFGAPATAVPSRWNLSRYEDSATPVGDAVANGGRIATRRSRGLVTWPAPPPESGVMLTTNDRYR
jgi:hypothetical protein